MSNHLRILASGVTQLEIDRLDDRTLAIRPEGGFLAFPFDRLYRSEVHPMAVGEKVVLTGLTVEVTDLTEDGRPESASFRFDVPLEDSRLRWLQWKDDAYADFSPPALGETASLPAASIFGDSRK